MTDAPRAKRMIFHLLPNAHLDPVWLWDWREGLNEGITTVRTVLDLMDEFPALTFLRGEAMIYEHIERTDAATFRRMARLIEEGRWDVVGGTLIQPDSNLPSTETLCRQFERGLSYFQSRFGKRPTVAWQADSFGHTPGWPNILDAFGMEGFAFTRPQREQFPLDSPLFWWQGDHSNRLLSYRQHWKWYCSERGNMPDVLNATLVEASKQPFTHVGILMGLGNHGGGPSRRHILDVEKWKENHPEIEVRYSTLHKLFAALREEIGNDSGKAVPTVRGDLGFCLRGCYSSVAKFKHLYRSGEAQIVRAEATASLIGSGSNLPPRPLDEAWDAVLFNAFHDILPGSSIERAVDEQIAWMGMASHQARRTEFEALNRLASKVDTSTKRIPENDCPADVPFLIWNPLPHPFEGEVELEGSLDYRPLFQFQGRPEAIPIVVTDHREKAVPFQVVATEHSSMPNYPWRRRVLVRVKIPAFGWQVMRLGWRDEVQPRAEVARPCRSRLGSKMQITNGEWAISVSGGILSIQKGGRNFFPGNRHLELRVVEDVWGSWGGMNEEKDSYCLEKVLEKWTMIESTVLESGPLRARLWTRWSGKNSWIDLTFSVSKDQPWVKVQARLLWNERSARLKLILPSRGKMEFDVPGSIIERDVEGQLPMGNWIRRVERNRTWGVASNALSDVDTSPNELRLTLARATRYANDVPTATNEKRWEPAVDCGELKFDFSLFGGSISPDAVAEDLLFPPLALIVPAQKGPLLSRGSLGEIHPRQVKLLSLSRLSADKLQVRIQNRAMRSCHAILKCQNKSIPLASLLPQQIKTVTIPVEHHF